MSKPITVDDMIEQVRSKIDEANTETVSDTKILNALNRGQDYISDILVRHYPDPLVTYGTTSTVAGQSSYSFPEDIFEDRLQKVEILVSGTATEVQRISYRDVSEYESTGGVERPYYYYVIGKTFNLVPNPSSGSMTIRYWYIRELDTLVPQQGRITTVDTVNNYIKVNTLGSDLTTESDNLYNYVNIVDAQTGIVKSSHQIQAIDTDQNKITFKAVPDRSSVYNRAITGTIASTVELDDFVCLSIGNCISYLKKPLTNHQIQFATVELKNELGEPSNTEEAKLTKFEDQVKHQWSGRENQLRVKKRNSNWANRLRRGLSK